METKEYITSQQETITFIEEENGKYRFVTSFPLYYMINEDGKIPRSAYESGLFDSMNDAVEYAIESLEYETAFEILMHTIADGTHDIDLKDFQSRMGLEDGWSWDELYPADATEMDNIHDIIHKGLR